MVASLKTAGLFYILDGILNEIGSDVWFGSPGTELKR